MAELEPTVVIQPIIFENEKFITNPNATSEQETDSVIIFNEEHRIPINKSLMIKRCTFFKYMINHGFKEAYAKEISINYNTDPTVFKALLDYIHTGKIKLTTANLEAVIVAAIYFQLQALLKFCCDVMMQNTDLKNVGQVYEFAKELALVELRKATVVFGVKHFNEVAKSKVFYKWIAACMLELLSSDKVEVSHEKRVLKFVFDWLNVDIKRVEHAAELFRKLRFTFLNDKIMEEVMKGYPNQKLGLILHQVASEFVNKNTPARIFHKGLYMLGYNIEVSDLLGEPGHCLIRYCPDDGNITKLKLVCQGICFSVSNGDNIFTLKFRRQSDSWNIHVQQYHVESCVLISLKSAVFHENLRIVGPISVCDEKIFVFLKGHNVVTESSACFCLMYCIKTNTWQRLSAFEGIQIDSSFTCGDSIYMTIDDFTNLLQYKPSTGEFIDIPCQYDLRDGYAIAYKSNILFFPRLSTQYTKLAKFCNTETKEFRSFDFTEIYKANGILEEELRFSLFRDFAFVFTTETGKVFKIDLSFIDESKEPTLIPLPDISGMRMSFRDIVSIE